MRILHITAMHLRPIGGIGNVLKNLTDSQNRVDGVESAVLSLNYNVEEVQSDSFFYLGSESIDSFLERYLPDMAIIHSFFHVEYRKVANSLYKRGIPYFIEPHSSFGTKAMRKSFIKKYVANNTIFRSAIKNSTGFIFLNEAELDDSVYRTTNDLIIRNGIDPVIVDDAKEKAEDSFESPTIVYLGRYDIHHKGLDYLFDALDILEKKKMTLRVKIHGAGSERQNKYVRKRVNKYRFLEVDECGPVVGEDKKKTLEAASIMILTSRYEGSPMTIWEGLAYGNPCIATPGTNVADELVQNRIGWQTDLSAESIADTIIEAIDDYKKHGREYYSRCQQYVLENYSWDKIGIESIELYKKALNT